MAKAADDTEPATTTYNVKLVGNVKIDVQNLSGLDEDPALRAEIFPMALGTAVSFKIGVKDKYLKVEPEQGGDPYLETDHICKIDMETVGGRVERYRDTLYNMREFLEMQIEEVEKIKREVQEGKTESAMSVLDELWTNSMEM
eukprot:gene24992-1632_t